MQSILKYWLVGSINGSEGACFRKLRVGKLEGDGGTNLRIPPRPIGKVQVGAIRREG